MKLAVIGGGIHGVMCAWALARAGHDITLFERGELMAETSAASSRMLHGGIRYLEHGHFSLVREALTERAWWLGQAPHLARAAPFLIPVYRGARRGRWAIGLGVRLYDFLARGSGFPRGAWRGVAATRQALPHLAAEGLIGAWEYWDGVMDDRALGLWAAEQTQAAGVHFLTHTPVTAIRLDGQVQLASQTLPFEGVINATGPWAGALLARSGLPCQHRLDLIRGTHVLIRRRLGCGCVLQDAASARVIFVLPQGEHALLGTTEVLQAEPGGAQPSADEIAYLRAAWARAFDDPLQDDDVIEAFAGVRPVVRAGADFSAASRESVLEINGRVLSVLGGKWTTSRALAEKVARQAAACWG
jgi:glycerol-3-phosphate dehydrogenase